MTTCRECSLRYGERGRIEIILCPLHAEAATMFSLLQRADSQAYFEKHDERERVHALINRVLGR